MSLYFLASLSHYIDHLAPVWTEMGADVPFFVTPGMEEHALAAGVVARPLRRSEIARSDVAVVASETDRQRARPARVIRFEHGVGISYGSRHAAYAGGGGQLNVIAFACPNRYAREPWRRAYPDLPCPVVGVPRLDEWIRKSHQTRGDPPTVAISFHWYCEVSPECRTAFPHYKSALPPLAARRDVEVVAHAHPSAQEKLRPYFEKLGVEFLPRFDEVLQRADLYVVDNSSTLYEFAATGRPVVSLNAPWYRRDVHHGLRFWEHADVGVQVDEPEHLNVAIDHALEDPPEQRALREAAVRDVFPLLGRASSAAADAVSSHWTAIR